MAKTAKTTKTASNVVSKTVAVINVQDFMRAWGGAQGEGRATDFRNEPTVEKMQALLDAAEANLRALMKGPKTKKTVLTVVASNDKPSAKKNLVKIDEASDAQIKSAYKAEFENELSTVAAMRKGLIKAGVKAVPIKTTKAERDVKPAKVKKTVSAKKPAKKKVDAKTLIKAIDKKIAKLKERREDTDDKAKRAKLLAQIKALREEKADLRA